MLESIISLILLILGKVLASWCDCNNLLSLLYLSFNVESFCSSLSLSILSLSILSLSILSFFNNFIAIIYSFSSINFIKSVCISDLVNSEIISISSFQFFKDVYIFSISVPLFPGLKDHSKRLRIFATII